MERAKKAVCMYLDIELNWGENPSAGLHLFFFTVPLMSCLL